ncbi:MAG: PEP-CTERM sorting domain-containing protein [Syntrophobacteraceae bacterium]
MKKCLCVVFAVFLVLILSRVSSASSMSYADSFVQSVSVASDSGTPSYWVQLDFPDSTSGTYTGGLFEYDNYVNNVELLTVTLKGTNDNSSSPIDIYLDFNSNHSSYTKIGSYNVPDNMEFTLSADIKNGKLFLNGVDTHVSLSNVNLNSFLNVDAFWVGYGCHFTHLESDVNLSVGSTSTPVPEPSTLMLSAFGLIAVFGIKARGGNGPKVRSDLRAMREVAFWGPSGHGREGFNMQCCRFKR